MKTHNMQQNYPAMTSSADADTEEIPAGLRNTSEMTADEPFTSFTASLLLTDEAITSARFAKVVRVSLCDASVLYQGRVCLPD